MKKFIKLIPFLLAVALLGQGCIQFNTASSNDGGVWRTADRGEHWLQKGAVLSVGGARTLSNANIIAFVPDPQDPQTVYIGTAENGLLYTIDGGESWSQPKELGSAKIPSIAVDAKNKCVVYAVTGGMAAKTSDCTRTWSKVYEESRAGVSVTSVAVDHFSPNNVYLTTSKGDVVKSSDAGGSWATVKTFSGSVSKLVIDPFDSRVLYAGTRSNGIWKSTDAGGSWVDASKGLEQLDGAKDFYDLAPDRSKRDSWVLVCRYGLIKTTDGGATWQKIPLVTGPGQARVYAFAVDPADGQRIYYSTATVFYKSLNGGVNWTTKRLPTSRVGSALMVSGKDPAVIYLGTLLVKK